MIENCCTPTVATETCPGYLPMAFAEFCRLEFPERMAFEDDSVIRELSLQGPPPLRAGYCDWVDTSAGRQVCVGWAWCRHLGDAQDQLAPGGLSSNVMFVDHGGRALGPQLTGEMLRFWLSMRPWQGTLQTSPSDHYGHAADRLN